jgi:hypothetical protein
MLWWTSQVARSTNTAHPQPQPCSLFLNLHRHPRTVAGGVAVKWDIGGGGGEAGGATDSGGEGEANTGGRPWSKKWRKLMRHHAKGHLMGCSLILRGCEGNIDNGQGILFNHAYVPLPLIF